MFYIQKNLYRFPFNEEFLAFIKAEYFINMVPNSVKDEQVYFALVNFILQDLIIKVTSMPEGQLIYLVHDGTLTHHTIVQKRKHLIRTNNFGNVSSIYHEIEDGRGARFNWIKVNSEDDFDSLGSNRGEEISYVYCKEKNYDINSYIKMSKLSRGRSVWLDPDYYCKTIIDRELLVIKILGGQVNQIGFHFWATNNILDEIFHGMTGIEEIILQSIATFESSTLNN